MAATPISTRLYKALGYATVTLVAVACIVVGIGIYARKAAGYYRAYRAKNWPQVQATVVDAQLIDANNIGKGRYQRSRYLKARCEYSFQGVRYVSDCIQTAVTNDPSALDAYTSAYRVGSVHVGRIQSGHPAEILIDQPDAQPLFMRAILLLLPLLFLYIGFGLLYAMYFKRR